LGNVRIAKASIKGIAADLGRLGQAMADGGSINLYGCSLADPLGDGQILIDRLAGLAKARVFASTNITGRGGDWVLKASSIQEKGLARPVNPFSTKVLTQWPSSLAAGITVTPTSGLVTTENGGTATFTVKLDASPGGNSVSIGISSGTPTEGTASP